MKSRAPDPHRLDLAEWVGSGTELQGEIALSKLSRLAGSVHVDSPRADPVVKWRARGRVEREGTATAQRWMHLVARVPVEMTCQRCLQPVAVDLVVDNHFRLARDESEAERLDATIETDVLAADRTCDLKELVEDELLLALPLVPRHDDCEPPGASARDPGPGPDAAETHRPFAALAQWQSRKSS